MIVEPKDDGVTHINIWTRGRTEVGRLLSNLNNHTPINHPLWGEFKTVEGLWYYLSTGRQLEALRTLYGFEAKKEGRKHPRVHYEHFDRDIRVGLVAKVLQNPELYRLFQDSTLPFKHYYVYGDPEGSYKLVTTKSEKLICDCFEWFRQVVQG